MFKRNLFCLEIYRTHLKKNDTEILAEDHLITDTSFGKINRATTYVNLKNIFGRNNIQDTINYAAEGMDSFMVTKIFSNTSNELVVSWQPDKLHQVIASVDCFKENTPYHTSDNLQVGSTLAKLVEINRAKINFYGTGWDYGGVITSYNNGKFKKSNILFQLDARANASQKIMGDKELNTDMPLVKTNLDKLFITKISLSLYNKK